MAARREQRKRIKRSITRPSSNALFSNRSSRAAANGPSGRKVGPKTGHERGRAAGPYSSVRDARPDRDNPRINSYRGHGRYPERPRTPPIRHFGHVILIKLDGYPVDSGPHNILGSSRFRRWKLGVQIAVGAPESEQVGLALGMPLSAGPHDLEPLWSPYGTATGAVRRRSSRKRNNQD